MASEEPTDADEALRIAAEALLDAYRQHFKKRSTDGIRANAPLRRKMGELKIALTAARGDDRINAAEREASLSASDRTWTPDPQPLDAIQDAFRLTEGKSAAVVRAAERRAQHDGQ